MSIQQDEEKHNYFFGLVPDKGIIQAHSARTAENQCQYMLPTLQRMAAAKPDMKLLDVGCGPGSISVSLARYMPSGQLTGVDVSEAVLEKAQQAGNEAGVSNVDFELADVYELPFEEEHFDMVHTHQAVAHFHDHIAALKEMLRVLRPGGLLCMREGDVHTARFYPDSPLLEECFQAVIDVHKGKGGATDAGRRLKAWTAEAGVPRENILATAGAWCYSTPEQRSSFHGARLWQGQAGDKAVEAGILTR